MGESASIIKVDVGGPLNRVQVLGRRNIVGGMMRVATEGAGLTEH